MTIGVISVFTFGPGALLSYLSYRPEDSGFAFKGNTKKKISGNVNAIVYFADRDSVTGKDVPVIMKFLALEHPPKGARLHYVRNFKRHFYELFNNNETHKLEPFVIKDKKSFPPELFKIPAAMQTYKDAVDYSPPTLMQKVAPGVLILTMIVVGILMVMTGD